MTAQLAPQAIFKAWDNNGIPLAGGMLTTFAAGTTTPQATYVDSTQTTQNTNPITLNFRGECNLWLDPSKAYKFLLQDSQGNTIPGWPVDNITIGNANPTYSIIPVTDNLYTLGSPSFAWANVYVGPNHAPLLDTTTGNLGYYARTAAELAAGVTPINFDYPPLYVDRYGTNTTPGTTDMTAAFNSAVKVAKTAGGKVRFGATWPYLTTGPINCTIAQGAGQYGFAIECEGNIIAATTGAPFYPSIIAKHTGHVFDCAGANGIDFINVSIATDTIVQPQTCFFMARNPGGASQVHRFLNCRVLGFFTQALFYNYGAESGVVNGCFFQNEATNAGTTVMEYTGTNVRNLSSTFITIVTGAQSCIDHQVLGGQFVNYNTDLTSDVFRFQACESVKIFGPWIRASGRAMVFADVTSVVSPVARIRLYSLQGENSGGNKYGIAISNPVALNDLVSNWTVDSCYFPNNTNAIVALGSNAIIDGWIVRNLADQSTGSISIPGTAKFCTLDLTGANSLTLGTSQYNNIWGQTQSMTITTRTHDAIFDTSAVGTWSPNFSALTVTGSPTVVSNIAYTGRTVTLTIQISGQTTLSATAGQQITGIPALATATSVSAHVQLWDATSNVSLGSGIVNIGGITMPTFTAGTHTTIITAQYIAS